MPRDGSGNYSIPPGTEGFPDTTIESAKYNIFIADVETDLNAPRPISSGGTGAANERDAMIALGGEYANQDVTNYDSFPFVSGSFSSAAGATASPVAGHAFTGQAVIHDDPLYATITAHDLSDTAVPGRNYIREKKAGVWSAWKVDGRTIIGDAEGIGGDTADMFFGIEGTAPTSAFVVNNESDNTGTDLFRVTKSGNGEFRSVPGAWTVLSLHKSAAAMGAGIAGYDHANKLRWSAYWGDGGTETGANAGSNFAIYRYDDAGNAVPGAAAFSIERANGNILAGGAITALGNVKTTLDLVADKNLWLGQTSGTGSIYFTAAGDKYLYWAGTSFILNGGDLSASNHIKAGSTVYCGANGAEGVVRFGNNSSGKDPYIYWNNTEFVLNGGRLNAYGGVHGGALITATTINAASTIGAGEARLTPTSLEIGYDSVNTDYTYIDFKVKAGQDYGVRLAATGGSSGSGTSAMGYNAARHDFAGPVFGAFTASVDYGFHIASGGNARYASTVNGMRMWSMGAISDGRFAVADESAARFTFFGNLTGAMETSGGLVVNSDGLYTWGIKCKGGTDGGYQADWFNIGYDGVYCQLWVDGYNMGNIYTSSDYRIKKDVIDLPSMWDTVKGLRPIKYTQAEYSPAGHQEFVAEQRRNVQEKVAAIKKSGLPVPKDDPMLQEVPMRPLFRADDIERWGFIAHELQETLVPSAATGVKDDPVHVQSPEALTVVAALTKALQEAMVRIEALEAGTARR